MDLSDKRGSHEVAISPRLKEGKDDMMLQPCDESGGNKGPGYMERMKGSHAYQYPALLANLVISHSIMTGFPTIQARIGVVASLLLLWWKASVIYLHGFWGSGCSCGGPWQVGHLKY